MTQLPSRKATDVAIVCCVGMESDAISLLSSSGTRNIVDALSLFAAAGCDYCAIAVVSVKVP